MSTVLPDFNLNQPATVEEAIGLLKTAPVPRLLAGGTDLIVNMRKGLVEAETLIDLGGIDELNNLEAGDDGLYIGAGVNLHQLVKNSIISARYGAICEAAVLIAGPSHRQAATVGGNLCLDTRCLYYNQSHWLRKSNDFCLKFKGDICHVAPKGNLCRAAFCGDLAPALLVHDAKIEIAGPAGRRKIRLADFYSEDGADHLALDAFEFVTAVILPPASAISAYEKVRIRGAIDFPLAGIAVALEKTARGKSRFASALTGTNSCPIALEPMELGVDEDPDTFFAALGKIVQKQASPQRTTTTTAQYRRLSVAALAVRLARRLWAS